MFSPSAMGRRASLWPCGMSSAAVTRDVYKRQLHDFARFHAHDGGRFFRCGRAAGHALIDGRALDNGLGVVRAAGIAARAAVGARKHLLHLRDARVFLHLHEMRGGDEHDGAQKADDCDDQMCIRDRCTP